MLRWCLLVGLLAVMCGCATLGELPEVPSQGEVDLARAAIDAAQEGLDRAEAELERYVSGENDLPPELAAVLEGAARELVARWRAELARAEARLDALEDLGEEGKETSQSPRAPSG